MLKTEMRFDTKKSGVHNLLLLLLLLLLLFVFVCVTQRIGVYNQHAADQLELSESPVEYLMVSLPLNPLGSMTTICVKVSHNAM